MRYTDFVVRNGYLVLLFALLLSVACGGGNHLPTGPSPVSSAVEFQYVLSGVPTESVAMECFGQVHFHPSWWGFAQVNMADVGSDTWAILFQTVPVGHHTLRIDAPPECATGAVTVTANGTALTERVPAKRGIALGFTVHADGSVTP